MKGERVNPAKQDEDRRRRTIIVEKKNGSFGFTLQSYGIHYKKEQEIEMITYVDYVEYDGPAYRAGMREGDVILSINGQDMEKADHKALVNFIKNCDTRMRMVVLFEDCVRKVELHIRYIQLQRILQSKTAELDRLCLKEREVLQGKWKSHSLPARKKNNSGTKSDIIDLSQEDSCCRTTVSTEDVARIPNQSQPTLAYQYLDPRYPCVVQSESSNECLVGWTRESEETQPILAKANCDFRQRRCPAKSYHPANGLVPAEMKKKRSSSKSKQYQNHTRHLCNPCMQAINNQDNNSLEAYDLASPCCEPHCVPSGRRKSKTKNKHSHQTKNTEQEAYKENVKGSLRDCSGDGVHKSNQHKSHRYLSSLVSQFSLHSCTSSDASHGAGDGSGISYTTSLSSDTLYWDGNDNRTRSKPHSYSRTSSCKSHSSCDNSHLFQPPAKPKSWDNLTTKAFGGYGFGYGYVDAGFTHKNQSHSTSTCNSTCHTMPAKVKSHSKTNGVVNLNQINFKSKTGGRIHSIQIYHNGHRHYSQPAKSSESLLLATKTDPILTNSSHSCECLEIGSPLNENSKQFFPNQQPMFYLHQNKGSGHVTDVKQSRGSEKPVGNISRL
ncbi:hypothetical protein RUM44_009992 [Polyplax serrata]|uniref:PDZ domain-containing protein n=1 Tax=Polyplax serrata TaxID=468196 RepID=A0ABR1AUA3_POLSC